MHSVAAKIVSLVSLFLLTFLAGIVPLKLRRKSDTNDPDQSQRQQSQNVRRRKLISLCTCFAGGAFFASSMLELIPIVNREFDSVLKTAGIKTDFPLAEFGIAVGFFFILTVEQVIHVMKEKSDHSDHETSSTSSLVGDGSGKIDYGAAEFQKHLQENVATIDERESGESDNDEDETHGHNHADSKPPAYRLGHHHVHHDITDDSGDHHDHSMFFDISAKHQNKRHYLRSYLLLIALSIHALFEGLAVGLFKNVDDMVELLGALIIHKCILAFSIGINLVQHSFPVMMIFKSAFLFSAMSPIGVGIGILLLTYTSGSLGHIFAAVFQAIATGTFLYVTFFEIFFHELNSKECHKLLKVLMLVLGFSLITVVQYFETRLSMK